MPPAFNIVYAQILEGFYTFLWPMLRISALMLTAPVFSLDAVTVRIRVLFALALTILVYPLAKWPVIDPLTAPGLFEIFNQILIGSLIGLMFSVVTAALVIGGQAISAAIGLSMANMIDPNVGNVPVISQFLVIVSTLIFVGMGGHTLLVAVVLESFRVLPIGQSLVGDTTFTNLVAWSSLMFAGALLLALPVVAALLFVNVGLGVVTRAAPSLNIFAVGFAAMIPAGFFVMIVSMTHMGNRIEWLWLQSFLRVRSLLGLPSG
ncbi:MAG: flagellar biosynthetic protein FliR [Betaproteobacteria bacterium]|jgi:flagellar biosynthetic protein FliR